MGDPRASSSAADAHCALAQQLLLADVPGERRGSLELGARLIETPELREEVAPHASFDRTCQSQKPAISSFASANGPSITVRFPPSNRTRARAPFELGWSPSAASITPAFTSSSLYFCIFAMISVLGSVPASLASFSLTRTMNRIVVSPFRPIRAGSDASTTASNSFPRNRHVRRKFLPNRQEAWLSPRRAGCEVALSDDLRLVDAAALTASADTGSCREVGAGKRRDRVVAVAVYLELVRVALRGRLEQRRERAGIFGAVDGVTLRCGAARKSGGPHM